MEKVDCKYHKLQLDLNFLQSCQDNNFFLMFLQFYLVNRNLKPLQHLPEKTVNRVDQLQEEQDQVVFITTKQRKETFTK